MKDISERAFPKGHFDEGHFEGRAFPKGERAKGMKGIVHKLEFSPADWEAGTPTSLFELEGCPDGSIRRHHSAFQQDHVDLHLQAQCITSFASHFCSRAN